MIRLLKWLVLALIGGGGCGQCRRVLWWGSWRRPLVVFCDKCHGLIWPTKPARKLPPPPWELDL